MTGNWAGNLGPNQLEENWIMGEAGSIAAMVRMTGDDATSMFEMITIEEVDGSLVLHIQQWDPGMIARTDGPQEMELVEITENSVKFKATSEGGMAGLGYSHPDADSFIIHVENPGSPVFNIPIEVSQYLEVMLQGVSIRERTYSPAKKGPEGLFFMSVFKLADC